MEENYNYMSLKNDNDNQYTQIVYNDNDIPYLKNMDILRNVKNEEIYNNNMLDKRRTPLMFTSKLIMGNNNNFNTNEKTKKKYSNNIQNQIVNNNSINLQPSKSLTFPDRIININENKFVNNALKDEYIKMDEDEADLSTMHWKYEGQTPFNLEKKHFPRKLNIGNYFNSTPQKKIDPLKINNPNFLNSYQINPNYINTKENNNNKSNNDLLNSNSNVNNVFPITNKDIKNEINNGYYKNIYNSKSQKIINPDIGIKKNEKNQLPYNSYSHKNLFRYEEKPEYIKNRYNNRYNEDFFNEDNDDENMDIYNGIRRYKYYSPKRNDYRGSRYGDYSYNYYLNAPMRGDKSQSWKYPPLYYYNSGYKLNNGDSNHH